MTKIARFNVALQDGCKISIEWFQNDKRPLALFHANGFTSGTYRQLIDVLLQEYEIFAVDFRGQGNSERGSHEINPNFVQHSKDVINVVETLNIKGCNAFGHSMGATIILLAEQASPGLFESMFLYETVLSDKTWSSEDQKRNDLLVKSSLSRQRKFLSEEEAFRILASKKPFNSFNSQVLQDYIHYGFRHTGNNKEIELITSPESEAQIFTENKSDIPLIPEKIKCKVMVSIGDSTSYAHYAIRVRSFELVEKLPEGVMKVFCGLSHFGPFEDPYAIGESCIQFFRKQSIPRSRL
eukprot:g8722.t1